MVFGSRFQRRFRAIRRRFEGVSHLVTRGDHRASKETHRNQVEDVEYIDPSLSAQSLPDFLTFAFDFNMFFVFYTMMRG